MIEEIQQRRLIFVTGKGGVGKSVCSGAIAVALARRGRRVLIVETDTFASLPHLFGVSKARSAASRIDSPVRLADQIDGLNLVGEECLVRTLTRFLPSETAVRAITQNRVTSAFFQSAPSVNEFVLLDQIMGPLTARYDHVIVDLPASGHALTFLAVPKTLSEMMRGKGPIASRADELHARIGNGEETAIVAVSLPEELPVQETIELASAVEASIGRTLTGIVVNMVHDSPIEAESDLEKFRALMRERLDGQQPVDLLAESTCVGWWRLMVAAALSDGWRERDLKYRERLASEVSTPMVDVPMFFEVEDARLIHLIAGSICGEEDRSTKAVP